MELEKAQKIANEVMGRLAPYCTKSQIAGSVRRQKPQVRDIDIVLIPSDPYNLDQEIRRLGPYRADGKKLKRILCNGVQVDLYLAEPETWATLLLIRTGSVQSNIRLATLAKKRGWHLAASGDGLFDENGRRIAGDSEQSIYQALDLPFREPWERD